MATTADYDPSDNYPNCRRGLLADRAACLALALHRFPHDRLHIDASVPDAMAEDYKRDWISRAFYNPTRWVYVCDEDGINGFIIMRVQPNILIVDLICVGEGYERQGIGRRLLAIARWKRPHLIGMDSRELHASTSSANEAGVAFWRKNGFVAMSSHRTFHKP